MFRTWSAALLGCAVSSSVAVAQPTIVVTGTSPEDLAANGLGAIGGIYNATVGRYFEYRFIRGIGAVNTGANWDDGRTRANADMSVCMWGADNREDLGGLGNFRTTPHVWTASTLLNIGTLASGNECDYSINTGNDISGDGRYVVGGGWTERQCGPYRGWVYDRQSGQYEVLPFTTASNGEPARATRADSINADGTVVCGYDENYDEPPTFIYRRAAVWRKVNSVWTEFILDPLGGEANAVSADGNVVVGRFSSDTMKTVFGTTVQRPIRWTWNGSDWVPQNLGGSATMIPYALSADGSTVVGGTGNGFIWRSTINGGVAINLDTYIRSIGWAEPDISVLSYFGIAADGISADGTKILAQFEDKRSACLSVGFSAIIDLNGSGCEPARINFDPQSMAIIAPDPYFGDTFNVFASGTGPLVYQWQKETSPGVWVDLVDDHCSASNPAQFDIKGSSNSQLRVGHLSNQWQGNYRCVVTSPCGSATSGAASLSPCGTPGIALQPSDVMTSPGSTASFSTMGSGGGMYTFQWRRDGVALADGPTGTGSVVVGSDTDTMKITNVSGDDIAIYDCVVSNPCSDTTCDGVMLTVCLADFNHDGFVNGNDYDDFAGFFDEGDPAADVNHDGFVNGDDYDLFASHFDAGC